MIIRCYIESEAKAWKVAKGWNKIYLKAILHFVMASQLFLMLLGAKVRVVIFELSSTTEFLFRHLKRTMIMIRLCYR